MQVSTSHDVEMPADALFDAVADFDLLERMMVRRGAQVTRLEPPAGSPMSWDIAFDWRGRRREMRLHVTSYDRPEKVQMHGTSDSFDVEIRADIVALSRYRSRLVLTIEGKARTIKARLMLQTAKLTRGSIDKKFEARVAAYLDGLAARDA
ncbi:SRPBCC family protein [Paracoccus suum]|uniref:SRPBCC family protein n=1 Tax=Paracoccus suum TaxID=2259340 RepID=A0A344PMR3_9RHOB|nr:SRPBCC family protein [Paracoccus suum]AXC50668.1 SRPBCC family protein [Paracoccus suum]